VIDVHCHILAGIDDGARDVADSLAMARQAEADGIEIVCATPHIRHDHDVRIGELGGRVADLNAVLQRERIAVRIATGGEVAETIVESLTDADLATVTLGGGGRWILLEPAPGPLARGLTDAVEQLATRGFRAIVAHPERHPTPDLAERLEDLVRRGALIQVTAALLSEGEAVNWMLELTARGVVHLLGSDAHSSRYGRPLELSPALSRLRTVELLAPHVDWIAHLAPAAVLRGEDVSPPW
jgi:protein-tyrosine phosphatase